MTKFKIEYLGRSHRERLGVWVGGKTCISTPAVWISSQGGTVPNLTPETIQYLVPNVSFAGILVPFQYHTRYVDVFEKFAKGIDVFMGLQPNRWNVLIAPQDPGVASRQGYHTNKEISLWDSTGNRVPVDFSFYDRGVKSMRPDAYVSLCDGETPKNCPKKRIAKATAKSLRFIDQHLAQQSCEKICSDKESIGLRSINKSSFLFGAIEGGYDIEARQLAAKQVAEKPVDGFFIDGFHLNGEESLALDFDDVKVLINESIIPNLPENKPRLYHGICSPNIVLKLVAAGIDMFDSSYVRYATDNGKALIFPNSIKLEKHYVNIHLNESLITEKSDFNGIANNHGSNLSCFNSDKNLMDLKDAKFKNDFRPISNACSCYTCRKHTRAYINHLLTTNELLAPVLLTLHNLHHYATFFETIRVSIQNDEFHKLQEQFL